MNNNKKNNSIGISPNYVSDWTIQEAIRELVQNNIDARQEFDCDGHITYKDKKGRALLKDEGEGLKMKHLVMGISEKSENAVGQFGEGMKLALLVFAREGRWIEIWSRGKKIVPKINYSKEYETDLISLEIEELEPHYKKIHSGTSIKFECSEQELEEGKNYFIQYYKRYEDDFEWISQNEVSLPGGQIWVNGSMVGEIDDAKFSYHFTGEEARDAINRDRGSIDTEKLNKILVKKIGRMRSVKYFKEFMKIIKNDKSETWESKLDLWNYNIKSENETLWRRAMNSVFGKNATLESDNSQINEQLKYQSNTKIVSVRSYKWKDLLGSLGMNKAMDTLQKKTKRTEIAQKDLNESEYKILKKAKSLIKKHYNSCGRVVIVEKFVGKPDTLGQYDRSKDIIYVKRGQLFGLHSAVDTILHECIHKHSGQSDKTAGFERAYGKVATDLLIELM